MLEQLALLAAFSDIVKAVMYLVIIGSALLLIAVILLQEGKGGGFGDAFGGMGTETFGARVGGVNKFTATIAAFFLVSILGVHLINRPPAPIEPEMDTAEMQAPNSPTSPFGQDPNSPFGTPDQMGNNLPAAPGLTPQQIAERQFQLFGGSSASSAPESGSPAETGNGANAAGGASSTESPLNGNASGSNASGSTATSGAESGAAPANPASASDDPWSDPSWGLSPEERSRGALAPEAPAAPAKSETPTTPTPTPPAPAPADGGGE